MKESELLHLYSKDHKPKSKDENGLWYIDGSIVFSQAHGQCKDTIRKENRVINKDADQ